jgi:hypothetical protein
MKTPLIACLLFLVALCAFPAAAQIYAPEGLNMPGSWDTAGTQWRNPPSIPAFAGIVRPYGLLLRDTTLATRRYRTVINVQSSGGTVAGGSYKWLYTSPFHWGNPDSTAWGNKWKAGAITVNTVQNYAYSGVGTFPPDSNVVTLVNGNWYTFNWRDNGYAATSGAVLSTAGQPVTIPSVTQTPLPGSVNDFDTVHVSATLSGAPPADQYFIIRYTTDNWVTSSIEPMTVVGTTASGRILPRTGGTTVKYYVFSSPSQFPSGDYDLRTLTHNNNNKLYYAYSVIASQYTITVAAGANGSIAPPGPTVIVLPGANITFTMTPDPTYYVDSVIVDGAPVDSSTTYTFTNVSANHSIRATFTQKVNVTFQVNMSRKMQQGVFLPDSGDFVALRGSFNNWGDDGIYDTLYDANNDSIYAITKLLKANSRYEHKFWKTVRGVGGYGYEDPMSNRVDSVAAADTTLPAVWFANDSPPVAVTFQVDMRVQMWQRLFRPDLGDIVTVRGSFNDWGNSTNNPDTLRDLDNDSVYTGSASLQDGVVNFYKFWKTDRALVGYEELTNNRQLSVAGVPITLERQYFGNDSIVSVWSTFGSGWNMISNPVNAANDSVVHLYPLSSLPYAFAFVPSVGYQQRYQLVPGTGYWGKFPGLGSSDVPGDYILLDSIDVAAGWNMIGAISLPVDTASVVEVPPGIISSVYFGYATGYAADSLLRPGKAYWVKASATGKLVLASNGPVAAPVAGPVRRASVLDGITTVTITDAQGAGQTLYITGGLRKGLDPARFDMPPAPPEGAFDARFGTQRLVETALPGTATVLPLEIRTAAWPVTIRWNLGSDVAGLQLRTGKTVQALAPSGSVQIPAAGSIAIEVSGADVPKEFALSQNYPNPFNPATTIAYALPYDAKVNVTVFDMLGRRIATLVDDQQPAGHRTVQWDGRNAAGMQVASGLYFCRLEASPVAGGSPFTAIRKMMLLK